MNTFNAITHIAEINGRRVPTATQVLRDLMPGWQASQWHMERGRAVHAAAAILAAGGEPEITDVDPDNRAYMEGCVAAVKRFFRELRPVPVHVERTVFSERYQYAGTLDLVATIDGLPCIFDWKASLMPSLPYQLAAYALALDPVSRSLRFGYGVEIRPDGTYQMSERHDLRTYTNGWLAMLTVYGIWSKYGLTTKESDER